ncbi:28639_t:CDS:1, partial [Gigaspora margarita]
YETFSNNIKELGDDSNKNTKKSYYVYKLHESFLELVKQNENKVTTILEKFAKEIEYLKQEQHDLCIRGKIKKDWAIGLAFIPVVNIIACPILGVQANSDFYATLEKMNNILFVVKAADIVKNTLNVAIVNFITAITKITSFFALLTHELKTIAERHVNEEIKTYHFEIIKSKSSEIVDSCRYFVSKIPDCKTDL